MTYETRIKKVKHNKRIKFDICFKFIAQGGNVLYGLDPDKTYPDLYNAYRIQLRRPIDIKKKSILRIDRFATKDNYYEAPVFNISGKIVSQVFTIGDILVDNPNNYSHFQATLNPANPTAPNILPLPYTHKAQNQFPFFCVMDKGGDQLSKISKGGLIILPQRLFEFWISTSIFDHNLDQCLYLYSYLSFIIEELDD